MEKKFLIILIFILSSCSNSDDNESNIRGCTDPQAVNYNIDANEDDGSCLYSIVGGWEVITYALSDGTNVMNSYDYIDYEFKSDNSFVQYIGITGEDDELIITGTYSLSGFNNSTLTFYIDQTGEVTVSTITSISSNRLKLIFEINSSSTAMIELARF